MLLGKALHAPWWKKASSERRASQRAWVVRSLADDALSAPGASPEILPRKLPEVVEQRQLTHQLLNKDLAVLKDPKRKRLIYVFSPAEGEADSKLIELISAAGVESVMFLASEREKWTLDMTRLAGICAGKLRCGAMLISVPPVGLQISDVSSFREAPDALRSRMKKVRGMSYNNWMQRQQRPPRRKFQHFINMYEGLPDDLQLSDTITVLENQHVWAGEGGSDRSSTSSLDCPCNVEGGEDCGEQEQVDNEKLMDIQIGSHPQDWTLRLKLDQKVVGQLPHGLDENSVGEWTTRVLKLEEIWGNSLDHGCEDSAQTTGKSSSSSSPKHPSSTPAPTTSDNTDNFLLNSVCEDEDDCGGGDLECISSGGPGETSPGGLAPEGDDSVAGQLCSNLRSSGGAGETSLGGLAPEEELAQLLFGRVSREEVEELRAVLRLAVDTSDLPSIGSEKQRAMRTLKAIKDLVGPLLVAAGVGSVSGLRKVRRQMAKQRLRQRSLKVPAAVLESSLVEAEDRLGGEHEAEVCEDGSVRHIASFCMDQLRLRATLNSDIGRDMVVVVNNKEAVHCITRHWHQLESRLMMRQ